MGGWGWAPLRHSFQNAPSSTWSSVVLSHRPPCLPAVCVWPLGQVLLDNVPSIQVHTHLPQPFCLGAPGQPRCIFTGSPSSSPRARQRREESLLDVCAQPLEPTVSTGKARKGGTRHSVTSDRDTQSARWSEEKPLQAERSRKASWRWSDELSVRDRGGFWWTSKRQHVCKGCGSKGRARKEGQLTGDWFVMGWGGSEQGVGQRGPEDSVSTVTPGLCHAWDPPKSRS